MTTEATPFFTNNPQITSTPQPLQLMDPSPLTFQLHFPLNQNANMNLLKRINNPKPTKPKTSKSKRKISIPKRKKRTTIDSALKNYLKKSLDIQEKRLNMTRSIPKPSFILQQKTQNRMQSNESPIIQETVTEAFAQSLKDERANPRRRNEVRRAQGKKGLGRKTNAEKVALGIPINRKVRGDKSWIRADGSEESKA